MDRLIKALVLVAGLVVAATVCGWLDGFHLSSGAALLGILGLGVWLWHRRRRGDDGEALKEDEEVLVPSPIHSFLMGALRAAACTAYLWLGFLGLEQTPLYDFFYDRDRPRLEEKLRTLENAGNYSEAAQVVQTRLQQKMTKRWGKDLAARLVHDMIQAAGQKADLAAQKDDLTQALYIAKRYGMDSQLTSVMLDQVEKDLAFQNRIKEGLARQQWAEVATDLRAAIKDRATDPEGQRLLAQWLYDALVNWGQHSPNLEHQAEVYREAEDVAQRHALPLGPAAVLRRTVEGEIARQNRPTDLPKGARAGFVRLSTESYPPVFVADLWVENADGIPILGLKERDFRVTVGGKPARAVALAPIQAKAPSLSVVLAIDISGSMNGAPLDAAKRGARIFLASLQGSHVEARVLAFSNTTQHCWGWSSDLKAVGPALDRLEAGGNTALLKTIVAALDDLAQMNGDKRLVLFTDGKDTIGGPAVADLIDRCRGERVQIHAIGLRRSDLDSATLRQLAAETGGQYLEAGGPEDIVERYSSASRQIRRSVYRLVITPASVQEGRVQVPVRIAIGGGSEIVVSETLGLRLASQ